MVALRWPCWASSTSKGPGVLNQGASPLFSYTHTHTCAGALRCLYFPLSSSQSLPKKPQIKGCDSRLEDEPERVRGAL